MYIKVNGRSRQTVSIATAPVVEVERDVDVITEVTTKPVERIVYVDRVVEVVKDVIKEIHVQGPPVEIIKEVIKEVEVIKLVEVPVETIRIFEKIKNVKYVSKSTYLLISIQFIVIITLLFNKYY